MQREIQKRARRRETNNRLCYYQMEAIKCMEIDEEKQYELYKIEH